MAFQCSNEVWYPIMNITCHNILMIFELNIMFCAITSAPKDINFPFKTSQRTLCPDMFIFHGSNVSAWHVYFFMIMSSNGNISRVTGHLCGEFTGHRWIPITKASDAELWWFFWSAPWINGWVNYREAGELRRRRTHYNNIVMFHPQFVHMFLYSTTPTGDIAHIALSYW